MQAKSFDHDVHAVLVSTSDRTTALMQAKCFDQDIHAVLSRQFVVSPWH